MNKIFKATIIEFGRSCYNCSRPHAWQLMNEKVIFGPILYFPYFCIPDLESFPCVWRSTASLWNLIWFSEKVLRAILLLMCSCTASLSLDLMRNWWVKTWSNLNCSTRILPKNQTKSTEILFHFTVCWYQ